MGSRMHEWRARAFVCSRKFADGCWFFVALRYASSRAMVSASRPTPAAPAGHLPNMGEAGGQWIENIIGVEIFYSRVELPVIITFK